jgi:hypothetical protein
VDMEEVAEHQAGADEAVHVSTIKLPLSRFRYYEV